MATATTRTQGTQRIKDPAKKATGKKAAPATSPPRAASEPGHSLPVLVPEVHVRHLPLPKMVLPHLSAPHLHVPVPEAVRSRLPESSAEKFVWFGGLAGLAALGVINWPVAGVVAVGTYVAERSAKDAMREELEAGTRGATNTKQPGS